MWGLSKTKENRGDLLTLSEGFFDYSHANQTLQCSFEPEREDPPKLNTIEGSAMGIAAVQEAMRNGGVETGKYYLFVIITAPETLSGLGSSEDPVLHVFKLLEFVETKGKTSQGATAGHYKLEAQGLPPNEINGFVDTSSHTGKIVCVERILFEDKVLTPIYMSDLHDHELKNSIGIALKFG
ncbi:MAG: hypothetical protein H8E17_16440 [Deltaproteobacteria bacterium]|nr:hypothetical protein [Deltaproteobacteria bacterium]